MPLPRSEMQRRVERDKILLTLADVIAAILHQQGLLRDLGTALQLHTDSRTRDVEDCLVIHIVTTVPGSVQVSSRAACM